MINYLSINNPYIHFITNVGNNKCPRSIVSTLLILLIHATILSGCTLIVNSEWKETTNNGSKESYQAFIKKYPDTKYAKWATQRLSKLLDDEKRAKQEEEDGRDYKYVSQHNNNCIYINNFIIQKPLSAAIQSAVDAYQKCFYETVSQDIQSNWKSASNKNTIEAYNDFLVENPESPYIKEARKGMEILGVNMNYGDYSPNIIRDFETIKKRRNEKDNNSKLLYKSIVYPVFSNNNVYKYIYKNEDYKYIEVTMNGRRVLPKDYELLKLRYIEPYQGVVLFVPVKMEKFVKEYNEIYLDAFLQLTRSFEKDMNLEENEMDLIMFLSDDTISKLQKKHNNLESMEYIDYYAAQLDNKYTLTLKVSKKNSFYQSSTIMNLINEISNKIITPASVKQLSLRQIRKLDEPIIDYSKTGNIRDVLNAVNKGSNINATDNYERTPLYYTITNNHIILSLALIKAGASINNIDYNRNDALHISYLSNNIDIKNMLVAYGADNDSINDFEITPVQMKYVPSAYNDIIEAAKLIDNQGEWTNYRQGEAIYRRLIDNTRRKYVMYSLVNTLTDIKDIQTEVVLLAVKLGIEESEDRLLKVLDVHGNIKLAEDFLNSGSAQLVAGATEWANRNGYIINRGQGSKRAKWGSFSN